jgi:dTDP-4-dehydrorhamnose reductase
MSRILVTGAAGQLGSELVTVSRSYPGYEFIFTDVGDLDITDRGRVNEYIASIDPAWIINCAAYNMVDRAEAEPDRAMLINREAVKNIADAVKGSGCRFIHISSDYVFDGRANTPYREDSPTAPLGSYGRSKLAGEKAALAHNGSMVIRTSWLYSSHGSNFVKTIIRKSSENKSVNVVVDQAGTPTYAADLANTVMHIIAGVIRNQFAFTAGIYHYSNEGVCSWYDFAVEIVREAGIDCKVLPLLSSEYKTAAPRPSYSVLDKTKIKETYRVAEIPYWRFSLKKCIELLNNQ